MDPELLRRLAAFDDRCDYRMERKVCSEREQAGRSFRFWTVTIARRGKLDQPGIQAVCQAAKLVDAIRGAVESAERTQWK